MNKRHQPHIGDIWKSTYYPDLYWSPQVIVEEHYLIYEATLDSTLALNLENGIVRRVTIQDWFTTAKLSWEKMA